eukprot:1019050-Rhodomonas_salina.1
MTKSRVMSHRRNICLVVVYMMMLWLILVGLSPRLSPTELRVRFYQSLVPRFLQHKVSFSAARVLRCVAQA